VLAGDDASVTLTVKLHVPTCVGVPEMTPAVGGRESPGGNAPLAIDHVSGGCPPEVAIVAEYGEERLPAGNVIVTIRNPVGGLGAMAIVSARSA